MKHLLIIAHTPSENTVNLVNSLLKGASHSDFDKVNSIVKSPFDSDASDVKSADAVILFTTENFGYMSGALKDFFDRTFYDCLEQSRGLPYALVIRAGNDGTGTKQAVQSITQALKWRPAQTPLICQGELKEQFFIDCKTLGMTVAAMLNNDLL